MRSKKHSVRYIGQAMGHDALCYPKETDISANLSLQWPSRYRAAKYGDIQYKGILEEDV
jgi:hypothetical protein